MREQRRCYMRDVNNIQAKLRFLPALFDDGVSSHRTMHGSLAACEVRWLCERTLRAGSMLLLSLILACRSFFAFLLEREQNKSRRVSKW